MSQLMLSRADPLAVSLNDDSVPQIIVVQYVQSHCYNSYAIAHMS